MEPPQHMRIAIWKWRCKQVGQTKNNWGQALECVPFQWPHFFPIVPPTHTMSELLSHSLWREIGFQDSGQDSRAPARIPGFQLRNARTPGQEYRIPTRLQLKKGLFFYAAAALARFSGHCSSHFCSSETGLAEPCAQEAMCMHFLTKSSSM